VHDTRAGEDIPGLSQAAQSRRQVERSASIASLKGGGFARIKPGADAKRE
jgi:hypothetical protein